MCEASAIRRVSPVSETRLCQQRRAENFYRVSGGRGGQRGNPRRYLWLAVGPGQTGGGPTILNTILGPLWGALGPHIARRWDRPPLVQSGLSGHLNRFKSWTHLSNNGGNLGPQNPLFPCHAPANSPALFSFNYTYLT